MLTDKLRDTGVRVEFTGLFRSCIPDPLQRARFQQIPRPRHRRCGMVPDMRATLVGREGSVEDRLLELKFIHVGSTRYSADDTRR